MPRSDGIFRSPQNDAAVAGFVHNPPVQLEFEIVELIGGNNVVAAPCAIAACATADPHQRAVDGLPARRHFVHLVTAPAIRGLAIEEQPPAGLLFCFGESIEWRRWWRFG